MHLLEDSKFRKAYTVVENHENSELCKILNEYDNAQEAQDDLLNLLGDKATVTWRKQ